MPTDSTLAADVILEITVPGVTFTAIDFDDFHSRGVRIEAETTEGYQALPGVWIDHDGGRVEIDGFARKTLAELHAWARELAHLLGLAADLVEADRPITAAALGRDA